MCGATFLLDKRYNKLETFQYFKNSILCTKVLGFKVKPKSLEAYLISLKKINITGPYCRVIYRAPICKRFKEPRARICKYPRNRFLAWRAGTTTLFDVPASQTK
jgi:hypothetical protein